MCGIAGIIYRNGGGEHAVGRDMTRMLQAMKHRGPDSTGYALYRPEADGYVMHVKLAEANGHQGFEFEELLRRSRESIKDLGDAESVAADYKLDDFIGTHAIGHARMATESDVDIANAHPYWAYPFPDVAVVHNGQLTNYFQWKRRLERAGHRFQSECDSEIIAVYLAERMAQGDSLEDSMRRSLEELDGVFTYICVTEDALGVAKDELGAKPLVLYESDDIVALASEEIAIRKVVDREIETYDPYEGAVMVWTT